MTIPKDKTLHFSISLATTLVITFLLYLGEMNYERSIAISSLLTLLAGIAKELYDHCICKSQFSIYDLIADFLGILVALAILLPLSSLPPIIR